MSRVKAWRREAALFIRFGLVGAIGFVVDATVLELLSHAGLVPAAARVISVLTALQVTFLLNGSLTFRGFDRARPARQWFAYLGANGVGAACNYAIFLTLTLSGWPLISERLAALAVASAAALAINFAGSRLLAFRPARSDRTA